MEPWTETAAYATVSILFFLLSFFAEDDDWLASIGCTGALVSFWALNLFLWLMGVVENWSIIGDLTFGFGFAAVYMRHRRRWLLALVGLFIANVALDGLKMANAIDYLPWAWAGNVTFLGQLACASFPGLKGVVRRIFLIDPVL